MGTPLFPPLHSSLTPLLPPGTSTSTMAPTLTFTAKKQGDDLVITVVSAKDLPQKDVVNICGYGWTEEEDPEYKWKHQPRVSGEHQHLYIQRQRIWRTGHLQDHGS